MLAFEAGSLYKIDAKDPQLLSCILKTIYKMAKKCDKYLKSDCEYILICKCWCECCIHGTEVICLKN